MAVHLKHLNGDSTFLLTFSLPLTTGIASKDGTFTVLTDPWLAESGAPQIHPKFAFAARKVPAHVSHLSQIPAPDVVVISQAKPDHCHEDTLRQLPADLPKTVILAHPDAAKRIRSWRYFNPAKVHSLCPFSETDHTTIIKFKIPAGSIGTIPGEATITLLRQPRDLTRLHNAIAITYRAPMGGVNSLPGTPTGVRGEDNRTSANSAISDPVESHQIRTMLSSPALKQHDAQFVPEIFPSMPLTPPETPPESEQDPSEPFRATATNFSIPLRSQRQRSRTLSSLMTASESASSRVSSAVEPSPQLAFTPPTPAATQFPGRPWTRAGSSLTSLPPSMPPPTGPLPPLPSSAPLAQAPFPSQHEQASSDATALQSASTELLSSQVPTQRARSISSLSAFHAPKTVSVLYAPHGIEFNAVKAYATTHLVANAALPLTLILHPFARIDNPWWLGGNISSGVPGALELVRRLMARYWINAHDEEKDESGVGLMMMKKGRWNERQVKGLLGSGMCNVTDLPCGEETKILG